MMIKPAMLAMSLAIGTASALGAGAAFAQGGHTTKPPIASTDAMKMPAAPAGKTAAKTPECDTTNGATNPAGCTVHKVPRNAKKTN